jgi:probable HAF family extracellular repeat protein
MVGWTGSIDVNYRRAVVGQVGSETMTELATPARYDSSAWGINDQGLIVGGYVPNDYGEPRAFTCSDDCSDFVDLNTVTSGLPAGEILYVAVQVNNKGLITAYSDTHTYLLRPKRALPSGH